MAETIKTDYYQFPNAALAAKACRLFGGSQEDDKSKFASFSSSDPNADSKLNLLRQKIKQMGGKHIDSSF